VLDTPSPCTPSPRPATIRAHRHSLRIDDCVVIELTSGARVAYSYPDAATASVVFEESRSEWNAGRNLVFYVRGPRGGTHALHPADDVAHLELAARASLKASGIEYREAFTFG
jgi:hypothetical protein